VGVAVLEESFAGSRYSNMARIANESIDGGYRAPAREARRLDESVLPFRQAASLRWHYCDARHVSYTLRPRVEAVIEAQRYIVPAGGKTEHLSSRR
jgi:hypothetical protein